VPTVAVGTDCADGIFSCADGIFSCGRRHRHLVCVP
jgi:hypothetical protein